MFEIKATKTYDEICTEDSTIELGLATIGYTSPIISQLREWFGARIVCDDDNFKRFYLRLARARFGKFAADLRLETIDKNFDPLVENYSEHLTKIEGEDKRTLAGHTVTHTPASTKITRKPSDVKDEETPAGYTSELEAGIKNIRSGKITSEQSGSSFDETQSDSDNKGLRKINPMSSTSVTTGTGDAASAEIQGLDWTYSSQQEQATAKGYSKVTHDMSGKPKTTEEYDDLTDERSGKDTTIVTYNNHRILERTFKNDEQTKLEILANGSDVDTYQNPEKMEYGKVIKDRYTGRTGKTPQAALQEAIDYLRGNSPAFMELLKNLEPAFLGVYDI